MCLHFGKHTIDVLFRVELISVSSVYVCSVQLIGTRRDPTLSEAWAWQPSREKQVCSSMRVSIENNTSPRCKQNEFLQSPSDL